MEEDKRKKNVFPDVSIGHLVEQILSFEIRFMNDLMVAHLRVRIRAPEDNIYRKRIRERVFFSVATSSESVKCPEQNVLSPARVTDSLS